MSVDRLLEVASEPLGPMTSATLGGGRLGRQLQELLHRRNGFFAFAQALHVFPLTSVAHSPTLQEWNAQGLWRCTYGPLADDHLFFAQDVFGNQFSVFEQTVVTWDAETGEHTTLADSIAGWAAAIVRDHRDLSGWPLALDWQQVHGPLPLGHRLVPEQPFVLGGAHALENLVSREASHSMRVRGPVAQGLHGLPDGTNVRLTTTRPERADAPPAPADGLHP